MQKKIELLAPAKDLNCGKEAILHGADAVYIGAPRFSARSAAGNSLADIKTLCDFAHLYDVRIYVALNTILKDEELIETEKLIHKLHSAGIDALIVQDMGITQLDLPPIPLHASTQTDNRTPEKVEFLQKAGFKQIVLARELSLAQIEKIAEIATVPLEVFVHGALCVSYSGQCYLSAAISGRSANRGECAQYCRLPYSLIDSEGKEILNAKHLLSLKDMNRSGDLEDLLDAGVSSFKIEGRLKDVTYVKNITAYYREQLDRIFERRTEFIRTSSGNSTYTFDPLPEKSFNRGFTSYFLREREKDITSFDTPKSVGEPIGTVKELKGNSFTVAGLHPLHNGDGLAFFNEKKELEGFRINKVEDNRVWPAQMPMIKPKTILYRNLDQEFEKILSRPSAERKIPVKMEFSENVYGFTLSIEDETGARILLTHPFKKEKANREQQENIRIQLSKLGNTPFVIQEITVSLEENWFVPSSLLAEMRRLGIDKLMSDRKIRYKRELAKPVKTKDFLLFPEKQLSYLGNVYNRKAQSFYQSHGVSSIDPAFEEIAPENVPLMFTKHCIRFSMGWCPVHQKTKSPYTEPFYLMYKETRLRLDFDCMKCEMKVIK